MDNFLKLLDESFFCSEYAVVDDEFEYDGELIPVKKVVIPSDTPNKGVIAVFHASEGYLITIDPVFVENSEVSSNGLPKFPRGHRVRK